MSPREYTKKLIRLAEYGIVSWEAIARECMCQMSDDDVGYVVTALELDDVDV